MMGERKKKGKEELSKEELEAIEYDGLVEMLGEDDAAYFEAAGIDDIGDK